MAESTEKRTEVAAEPPAAVAGIFAETANSLEESVVNHDELRAEDEDAEDEVKAEAGMKSLTLTRRSHSSGSDEFEDAKETLPPKGECCCCYTLFGHTGHTFKNMWPIPQQQLQNYPCSDKTIGK